MKSTLLSILVLSGLTAVTSSAWACDGSDKSTAFVDCTATTPIFPADPVTHLPMNLTSWCSGGAAHAYSVSGAGIWVDAEDCGNLMNQPWVTINGVYQKDPNTPPKKVGGCGGKNIQSCPIVSM